MPVAFAIVALSTFQSVRKLLLRSRGSPFATSYYLSIHFRADGIRSFLSLFYFIRVNETPRVRRRLRLLGNGEYLYRIHRDVTFQSLQYSGVAARYRLRFPFPPPVDGIEYRRIKIRLDTLN